MYICCCCCCCCCGWSDLRRANGFDRATLSQTLFTTLFCSHSRAFATHWSNMRHAWLSCICLRRLWLNAKGNVCVLNINSDFIKIAMEWNKWQIEHCLLLSTHFRLWGCFLCFVLFKNKQKKTTRKIPALPKMYLFACIMLCSCCSQRMNLDFFTCSDKMSTRLMQLMLPI